MLKFDQFLVNNKIFTYEEIDEIKEYGTYELKRDEKIKKLGMFIYFKNIVPYNLFFMISQNLQRFQRQMFLQIEYETVANDTIITAYLKKYLSSTNIFLATAIEKLTCSFADNILTIHSPTNVKFTKEITDAIINFFSMAFININSVKLDIYTVTGIIREYENKIKENRAKYVSDSNTPDLPYQLKSEGMIFYIKDRPKDNMPFIYYVNGLDGKYYILKMFVGQQPTLLEKAQSFKVGHWVEFNALFNRDEYEKTIVGSIKTIYQKPWPVKYDVSKEAIAKPRIELFSHTKYTTLNGLCSVNDVVDKAKHMGSSAIGFADTSNVQAYTEIANACQKANLTPIYGVEVQILKNNIPIVINDNSDDIYDDNNEYIVFDIETDGLNAQYNQMIEFGALKIKNRRVIEKMDIFLKPDNPLPQHIMELTNINESMFGNESRADGIKKIANFISPHSILIAHNGIKFDLKFLNHEFAINKYPPIKNMIIDTMQLSRAINTEFTRHNLGAICQKYKIVYDEIIAHRADYDAEVLYKVWLNMLDILKQKDVHYFRDINFLTNKNNYYFRKQYPDYLQVYAKNQSGLKQLYKLLSIGYTKNMFNNEPIVFHDELTENRKNLIIASSPFWGDVWDTANNGNDEELKNCILFYDYIFIAPPSIISHTCDDNATTIDTIIKCTNRIVQMARKCDIPVIAVSANFYTNAYDKIAHNCLINSKMVGGGFHRFYIRNRANSSLMHMRSTKEMMDELAFLYDHSLLQEIVVDNAYKFVEGCSKIEIIKKGLFAPKIKDVDKLLTELVNTNLENKYGTNIEPEIKKRLNEELSLIINKGYAAIYWISHLLVKSSMEDGYVVGSRGSVGSSLVAYLSDISEVNPLPPHYLCPKCRNHFFHEDKSMDGFDLPAKKCPVCQAPLKSDGHNIPFDSFLGTKGAEKVPDIDMNFSGRYQPTAHKFIHNMFGQYKAFKAGTVLTIQTKTAYGIAKKYFEEFEPELANNPPLIQWIINRLEGVKRTSGQHAGGMIIVPEEYDILDFCPYQFPPNVDESSDELSVDIVDQKQTLADWYCTHFPFEDIHDNLLKFDILGHEYPTRFKMMCDTSGKTLKDISFSDKNVINIFSSLEPYNISSDDVDGLFTIGTIGIPECSTDFAMKLIKDASPKDFGDLIRISGLSHGKNVWIGNGKDILANNPNLQLKDVVCCREDIRAYLISNKVPFDIAFKVSEDVRKGKGVKNDYVVELKKYHIPDWYIASLKAIRYLFPKAHATAYMIASYICGWFKIYQPIDFYAAYFTVNNQYFNYSVISKGKKYAIEHYKSIANLIKTKSKELKKKDEDQQEVLLAAIEMNARGLKILPISLEKSHETDFIITPEGLIPPFVTIENCGIEVAKSIVQARNEKKFSSIIDFSERTKANKKVIENLTNLGILDKLLKESSNSLFDL